VSKATQPKTTNNSPTNQMQWRRADLHVHTPGSRDYQEPGITYLDILQKAADENLDIIAFTDHNTIAGYAAMQQEINDLERWVALGRATPQENERLARYKQLSKRLLILPGFEFTATLGFHILALFDPTTSIRAIEHVLLRLNIPPAMLDVGATEVGATTDVLTAYRIMAEAGALVIAAHANSTHGVAMVGFDFGGQTKIAYTQDANLAALEVTDLTAKRRRTTASFFNGSKPEYPRRMHVIQSSDAHRLKGLPGTHANPGVGERLIELLLPEVSFSAIKALFASQDFSRTRPASATPDVVFDHVLDARKQGISIVQSFHEQGSRAGGRLHAILRDVVAFANTNGGTIWVGVSSNARAKIAGIDDPKALIDDLRNSAERMISPPLELTFTVMETGGKHVVQLQVPRGNEQPYVLEGSKIYIRQETETSLAMREEIIAIIRRQIEAERPAAPRRGRRTASKAANMAPTVVEEPVAPEAPVDESIEPPINTTPSVPLSPENTPDYPHTGVEIVESVERKGQVYHAMRDLRDGDIVNNVTRASARRLWRYAIALKEKHSFNESSVKWQGDIGLWHRYLRNGKLQYDLVQRTPDGQVHIFYGVTEEGIHGRWKDLVERNASRNEPTDESA